MGEHSIDNKWNTHHPVEEVFLKELKHNSFFIDELSVDKFGLSNTIKKEISEETNSTLLGLGTVIKDRVILSTIIKNELSVEEPAHEELEQELSPTSISSNAVKEISYEDQAFISKHKESGFSEGLSQSQKLVQEEIHQERTSRGTIKCGKSDKHNTETSHLTENKLVRNGFEKCQCRLCNKAFIQCLCNKAVTQPSSILIHKLTETGIRKYQCDVCNKTFEQIQHVSQHKLTHSAIKKYDCNICNRTYSDPADLSVHKETHNEIRKYQCDICNKAFRRASNLSLHKLTHSQVRKYRCDVCNIAFIRVSNLLTHKLTHSMIRKYQCDVCNKAFAMSNDLLKHKVTHTGTKNYN